MLNNIRLRFEKIRNQKGAIGVISSVAIGAGIAVMTLSFDAGYIFSTQGELQNAADSAALAAVTTLPVTPEEASTLSLNFSKRFLAGGKNVELLEQNVTPGRYDFNAKVFNPGIEPVNAMEVITLRDDSVPSGQLSLFFTKMFGVDQVAVQERALAGVDPRVVGVKGHNHLIPYSVLETIVDQNGDGEFDLGNNINLYLRNGADKGNFGFLNLNGGSLSGDELKEFIMYGYDMDLSIPPSGVLPINGDTGIHGNSLTEAFESVYYDFAAQTGTVVYAPVHRAWSGNGANAIFEVVDFVALKIRNTELTGNINSRKIMAEITQSVSSGFIVREGAADNNSLQKLRLIE